MTAEIVVMNKIAVALAADSAVTVRHPHGGKVFNTANKLFTLSKYRPVGLMLYGGSNLNGVPWETLVKMLRQQLGKRSFAALREYGEALVAFLQERVSLFPESEQESHFGATLGHYYETIREEINQRVREALRQREDASDGSAEAVGLDELEIRDVVDDVVQRYSDRLQAIDFLDGMDTKIAEEVVSRYSDLMDRIREYVFQKLVMGDQTAEKLKAIGGLVAVKHVCPDMVSGLVIAGFGDSETFPSFVSYEIDGVVCGHLRYRCVGQQSVSHQTTALIRPFAQQEVVQGFMNGIGPDVEAVVDSALSTVARGYPLVILGRLEGIDEQKRADMAAQFEEIGRDLHEQLTKRLHSHIEQFHWGPVMAAVQFLPKDELAAMAESLVNLTSFRRRMSMDFESVGGPIDVAVISKGDGFIWIKRKHYFKAELNQQFFANYFEKDGGVSDEGERTGE